MTADHESLIRSYFEGLNQRDFEAIGAPFAEMADQEWPGSDEFIHGREAIVAVARATPTLPHASIHRIRSDGELTVVEWTADYGDGSTWKVASVFEFEDHRVIRKTDYFAEGRQPPEWRRGMTDVLHWADA